MNKIKRFYFKINSLEWVFLNLLKWVFLKFDFIVLKN